MAQREGSIYLYLFIGTFVLFVIMVVLFFVQDAKKSELETSLKDANKKTADQKVLAEKYNKDLTDLRTLVDNQAASAWPDNDVYVQKYKQAQEFINNIYKKLINRPPMVLNSLSEPIPHFQDIITKLMDSLQQAKELQQRADEEKLAAQKLNKDEIKKHEDLIASLRTQLTETENKYMKEISDVRKDNERLQKELAGVKDQMASAEIEHKRNDGFHQNQIISLKLRIDKLLEESLKVKTIDDIEPDGQILEVASTAQIGWVDIGRMQHLRPGLDFQVFQNVKGGKRQYKGRIEVQQVEEKISRFRILDTKDEMNPLAKGDFITSPFYDPKAIPVFVIAGEGLESKDITEEGLRTKIKSYGAQIKDDVDLNTTFLIALKNYEKTPIYDAAKKLGVAILRERDILEYMGL